MLRILYDELKMTDSIDFDDIALHNLKNSDIHYNKETFICSAVGWLKNKNTRTLQELELYLRNNNYNTYLIASPYTYDEQINLYTVNESKELLTFECIFCCKPKKQAFEDILKIHSSYEENFNKLLYSGMLKIKNQSEENTLFNKLCNNSLKLNFIKLTAKESVEQLHKDIVNSTGKNPRIEIIGKFNETQPIMTFLLEDGNLASHIGWTIEDNNKNLIYTLVDLNSYYSKENIKH